MAGWDDVLEGEASSRSVGAAITTMLATVWLVYLIDPIIGAWRQPDRARGVGGVACLVLFAAGYVWHFRAARRDWARIPRREGGGVVVVPSWRVHVARYVGLVALCVLAVVLVGQDGTASWVFLAVAGLWTWRLHAALAIGVVVIALLLGLPLVLPSWRSQPDVALSTALAMVAVGAGVVAGRRSHRLEAMQIENAQLALGRERDRVARDLHDILGHSLTVLTVKAQLANRLLDLDPEKARTELVDIERLSRDALADVRATISGMRTLSLPIELAEARAALAAADIDADIPTAAEDVPTPLRELFAWAVREGVTNVVRHSGARRCRIELTDAAVTIRDDGHGAATTLTGGHGLAGLRERATAAGAVVTAESLDPHGFSLRVRVPGGEPVAAAPLRRAAR